MPERLHPGPWLLPPMRVPRFYRGGAAIDAFGDDPERAGRAVAAPDAGPEDWIGSATRVWTPSDAPTSDLGLANVLQGRERRRLRDLLASDPAAVVGEALVDAAGEPTLGLLVKLLDAGERLPVHLHPDRAFARRHLGSPFGKTEAWIVLATQEVPGELPPHVRLGFREDVDEATLASWRAPDASGEALLAALHAIPVHPGDAWLVPAGVPHAIGAGVFLLELQEPSDWSIVLELAGYPIDPRDAHLRLGWDVAGTAIRRAAVDDRALASWRGPLGGGRLSAAGPGWSRRALLPDAAAPFFSAELLVVTADVRSAPIRPWPDGGFLIGVVVDGEGVVSGQGGAAIAVRRGSAFASPAIGTPGLRVQGDLRIIVCRPPDPAILARDLAARR